MDSFLLVIIKVNMFAHFGVSKCITSSSKMTPGGAFYAGVMQKRGSMTERVQCNTEGCNHQILAATAERTGGYCMPCVQAKKRADNERFIRENRKDVDLFQGVTDPVEIIRLHHTKHERDPLIRYMPFKGSIEQIYQSLSEFDEARLVEISIREAEKGNLDFIEYACLELAAFRRPNYSKLHKYMVKKRIYYPALIFKDASEDIVQGLLDNLEIDNDNANHILLCLAWAGGEKVLKAFSSWQQQAPAWSSSLYIPPQDYSKDAGWQVLPNGGARKLYFETCFPLLPKETNSVENLAHIFTPSDELCGWCRRRLVNFLELDITCNTLDFLGLSVKKLTLSSCQVCACYSDAVFMEFDSEGNSFWSKYNDKPDYLPDEGEEWETLPEDCLVLSSNPRPASYAANEFLPTTYSQVGGMPTWIQDFAYPDCPSCGNTMKFIAQISNEDIMDCGEGTYYMYICSGCGISATNYQQT